MLDHRMRRTSREAVVNGVRRWSLIAVASAILGSGVASADELRVLPEGKLPADARLQPLKDLNGYFPMQVPESVQAWERRAAQLRRQTLVALGLWPMPTPSPLKPVIHGRVERPGYTVERVYFESMPGFFVTGSLYRPTNKPGRKPGVLCPHGHWRDGRFHDKGEAALANEIKAGAEKFADSGRNHLQARCVHLARMGCVVLQYDMLGYADSTQISYKIAHRFARQRPGMNEPHAWGLFSPRAETHLQSVMGLQTYNSVRALDFLSDLPDVDPDRLAVTGASGGGTQSFVLAAVDPRVKVAFPAVMVSTAMQGGCTCENASLLRVGTGNIELAALFAPKPLALTAANDWTKEMSTKGFPELRKLYGLLGAADNVMLLSRVDFGHNFNYVSRAAMYAWFKEHLKLDPDAPLEETDFERLDASQLTVWNAEHPRPAGGEAFEKRLLQHWHRDTQRQLQSLIPGNKKGLAAFRETYLGGLNAVIGRRLPQSSEIDWEQTDKKRREGYLQISGLLRQRTHGEELPVTFLHPANWEGQVVIWIHPSGKAGMVDDSGEPREEIRKLLSQGTSVAGVDLLYQGEFLKEPLKRTRRVPNTREAAAYTFGYNHSLFARRVHDVLTTIAFVQNHESQPQTICLVGLEGAGPWVAAARVQAGDAVQKAVVDTGGFRFSEVADLHDPQFLPGGARYGDLPGMLALAAPESLYLIGEKQLPEIVDAAYKAAGIPHRVQLDKGGPKAASRAIEWLVK